MNKKKEAKLKSPEDLELVEEILNQKRRLFSMEPGSYYKYKKKDFINISYGKWAINELLDYIYEHNGMDVIDAIESFRNLMDDYCCKTKTEEATIVFICAYETATLVLEELYCLIDIYD